MPAATYNCIASETLSSAQSSVTFSTINQSFTDLVAIINAKSNTGTANIYWELNGDVSSNYSYTYLNAELGLAVVSGRDQNTNGPFLNYYGYLDTTLGNWTAHFMNYSNATTYKTVMARFSNTNNGVGFNVGLWRSTNAINQIKFSTSANSFATGSTFTLYGIKAE